MTKLHPRPSDYAREQETRCGESLENSVAINSALVGSEVPALWTVVPLSGEISVPSREAKEF